jgi:hypothetical protein
MLEHLFVLLVAPIIRRLVTAALAVILAAYLVTIPARLWVLLVDPRPSECDVIVINATSSGVLAGLLAGVRLRRWRCGTEQSDPRARR